MQSKFSCPDVGRRPSWIGDVLKSMKISMKNGLDLQKCKLLINDYPKSSRTDKKKFYFESDLEFRSLSKLMPYKG